MTLEQRRRAVQLVADEAEGFVDVGSPLPAEGAEATRLDWWLALRFWFGCSFMRGRADAISVGFLDRAIQALPRMFGDGARPDPKQLMQAREDGALIWGAVTPESRKVMEALAEEGLSNRNDREMVIDSLRFVAGLPENNIAAWAIERVGAGAIRQAYAELDGIRYVGHKIASMFLRETVEVYGLAGDVAGDDWAYTFPIDYWVDKVCIELGLWEKLRDEIREATVAVRACADADVDPVRFNRGAWLLGFKRGEAGIRRLIGSAQA